MMSSTSLLGQSVEDGAHLDGSWGFGLSWRVLGHRSLGFYSFNQSNPALQLVRNLGDRNSVDVQLRLGGRKEELLHSSILDLSVGYRRWIGKNNRAFFRASGRRVFITTEWQSPLDGEDSRHHWGVGVGYGRKFRILNDGKFWLLPLCSYELLADQDSALFGRLQLDLTIGYGIGTP